MPLRGNKVEWCDDDVLQLEDFMDVEVIYEIPNDEMLYHRFMTWLEFKNNDYYDGTPPPDFVTVIEIEED